ncbi:MAG: DUF547 domain-containing protein [Steroidobacteraceae bacterium]|uniref:DUF547 domain-containing protein n=1 Tax=Alcaligenes sp. SMD-FA TaxID=2991054 RepID=UPI002226A2F7|nr:DUF547 domain-containing protein [Alcaligenes sp. SMD-FA]UYY86333.1 DUF547 domain-containing protein [Alcaligenes sp. SMD-FA]
MTAVLRWVLMVWLGLSAITAQAASIHDEWDGLLKQHVVSLPGGHATAVDYQGMARDKARLKAYLARLAQVQQSEFDRWPTATQLAFLINAYNAGTVDLVLSGYPGISSIKDLGSLFSSPWKKRFLPLLGKERTLDEIEHELIRGSGRYRDPRVHFAVNCASIGCPALRGEAYDSARLDAQLDEQARRFLSDRSRNRLEGGTLRVSPIFKWYRGDFEQGWRGANALGAFLALYADAVGLTPAQAQALREGALPIEFLDYDWRLNARQAGR